MNGSTGSTPDARAGRLLPIVISPASRGADRHGPDLPVPDQPPARRSDAAAPRFWDDASGRFDPVRLRAAIVSRGWTVGDFAIASGTSRGCLYNALRGQAVSDRTVVRVMTTLDTRAPSRLIDA